MLKILIVLIFQICFFAKAAELEVLQGDFAVSDRVVPTMTRVTERINILGNLGSERLKYLKARGYACHAQTPIRWSCAISAAPTALTDDLIERIEEKWSGLLISVRAPSGESVLRQNSDDVRVWSVPQKVYVRTSQNAAPRSWNQISYVNNLDGKNSTWMIYLGDYRDQSAPFFIFVDQETIIAQDILELTTENITTKYYVDLYISRIQ